MIWGRVIDLFRRRRLDADLDAELTYHLDALEAEFRAKGLAPDEARDAARRAMGGLTQVKEAYHDQAEHARRSGVTRDDPVELCK